MASSSKGNVIRKGAQGQQDRLGAHPRDGYIIIEQNTWEEAQSANEQADFEVG